MGTTVGAVNLLNRVVKDEVIQHHVRLLPQLGIFRPSGQKGHRDDVFFDVIGRVIFSLAITGRDLHPVLDIGFGISQVFG